MLGKCPRMKKLLVLLLIALGAGGVAYVLSRRPAPAEEPAAPTDVTMAEPAEEVSVEEPATPTVLEVPGG